jgi:hypothetical protein
MYVFMYIICVHNISIDAIYLNNYSHSCKFLHTYNGCLPACKMARSKLSMATTSIRPSLMSWKQSQVSKTRCKVLVHLRDKILVTKRTKYFYRNGQNTCIKTVKILVSKRILHRYILPNSKPIHGRIFTYMYLAIEQVVTYICIPILIENCSYISA